MFKIFIDYNKAIDIVERESDDKWQKLFLKQNKIAVNHYVDIENEDDPLFLFSLNNGLEFCDEAEYINNITTNNERVLDNPCGAFYLDIDNIKAANIQENFGVICQNCNEMKMDMLTIEDIDVDGPNKNGSTWARFPFSLLGIPTNTLIIQDRHFCSSEAGETIQDSYDNFDMIIRTLLPQKFNDSFHLMLIIDATTINAKDHSSFNDISMRFNRIKDIVEREKGYNIVLEILSIPPRSYKYEKTHNRRIISNYYMIKADHKLKAFRSTRNLCEQTLTSKFLYSKGLESTLSDPPVKSHDNWISNFKDIIDFSTRSSDNYEYSCNGVSGLETKNIKNRILI